MALALVVVRFLMAALFLTAALSKLLGGFAKLGKTLADFGIPYFVVPILSVALPLAELICSAMLAVQYSARIGAVSALTMLLIFDVAIAVNLILGRNPQCNCFGELHTSAIGWTTFFRNGGLAVLSIWIIWQVPHQPSVSVLRAARGLGGKEIAVLAFAVIGFMFVLGEAIVLLHVLRQNGRLLLRVEALENAPTVKTQFGLGRAKPTPLGLTVGSKAIAFDLPNTQGSRATLESLLSENKPLLLISTDPNCGPCNALMPEVAVWQQSLASELTIALLSHGRFTDNQKKAAEFGLKDVLVEKKHEIAEKYHALGTPTAVLIRSDSSIGSHPLGGADAIRQFVVNRAWTEAGFAAFMAARALQPPPVPPKLALPVGSPAPAFALPDVNGRVAESANFNGNGTVLLFWNPGCGFCQKMIPQLKDWERNKVATAPKLVLVSSGSRDANLAMGLESSVLLDDSFAVGQSCGASGTPSGVLIDAKRRIASTLVIGAPAVMALLSGDKAAGAAQVAVARAGSSR